MRRAAACDGLGCEAAAFDDMPLAGALAVVVPAAPVVELAPLSVLPGALLAPSLADMFPDCVLLREAACPVAADDAVLPVAALEVAPLAEVSPAVDGLFAAVVLVAGCCVVAPFVAVLPLVVAAETGAAVLAATAAPAVEDAVLAAAATPAAAVCVAVWAVLPMLLAAEAGLAAIVVVTAVVEVD